MVCGTIAVILSNKSDGKARIKEMPTPGAFPLRFPHSERASQCFDGSCPRFFLIVISTPYLLRSLHYTTMCSTVEAASQTPQRWTGQVTALRYLFISDVWTKCSLLLQL